MSKEWRGFVGRVLVVIGTVTAFQFTSAPAQALRGSEILPGPVRDRIDTVRGSGRLRWPSARSSLGSHPLPDQLRPGLTEPESNAAGNRTVTYATIGVVLGAVGGAAVYYGSKCWHPEDTSKGCDQGSSEGLRNWIIAGAIVGGVIGIAAAPASHDAALIKVRPKSALRWGLPIPSYDGLLGELQLPILSCDLPPLVIRP